MRFVILLLGVSVFFPSIAYGVGFAIDLGIRPEDIIISPPPSQLVAGMNARVYATVHNFGQRDAKGVVSFYQGPILLGDPQAVSVKTQGFADEVFRIWKNRHPRIKIIPKNTNENIHFMINRAIYEIRSFRT